MNEARLMGFSYHKGVLSKQLSDGSVVTVQFFHNGDYEISHPLETSEHAKHYKQTQRLVKHILHKSSH